MSQTQIHIPTMYWVYKHLPGIYLQRALSKDNLTSMMYTLTSMLLRIHIVRLHIGRISAWLSNRIKDKIGTTTTMMYTHTHTESENQIYGFNNWVWWNMDRQFCEPSHLEARCHCQASNIYVHVIVIYSLSYLLTLLFKQ